MNFGENRLKLQGIDRTNFGYFSGISEYEAF